jgi:receptor-type tyrosine-protein phosphatase N
MIFVPIDEENPDLSEEFPPHLLPRDSDMYNYPPEDLASYQQPIFIDLPDISRLQESDINHPLEKREADVEADSGFEYILPEPDTEDLLMASLEPEDYSLIYDDDDDEEEVYPEISNYDFEYEDTDDQNQDDDILYYNTDNEPITVESDFNRRERLDVKKPGPFYSNSPNNFYLDKLLPDESESEEDLEDVGQTEYEYPTSPQERRDKKDLPLVSYSEPSSQDNGYLYINIKDRLSSRVQAVKLFELVADHLKISKQVFSEFQPETSRIVLKVNSNPKQLNASTMAKILEADDSIKEQAKQDLGIDIADFDSEEKVSVVSVYSGTSRLFLPLFLLTAGIAALLLLAAVLLFIRRRSQRKAKQLPEEKKVEKEEHAKEYKRLVRDWSRSSRASQGSESQHQSKGAENKILAKHSQNSDGSRNSSTSSWQEEPGVNSMDISTGHMVLSYMEDHLKNKQRLEQEWVGLCAYEAEPNATSIAFKVENKKKNRYPDKMPYDQTRVILNALVNGSNSDYINASTVMDHDPRNPAYIITQGPMTHTVADFWQMVWEQGSVVIVMLSKLSENGYQLCHRYWPEEGSEQYHIFEVHLVSEHVWCEDYLVRSLYLKNSQTGETRTVTQFHFLSWPDGNIPTSTKAILEFRRKVNKSYRGRSCPMMMHCSDGVGRSGTYVLIDMVLNRMTKGTKEIDIAATLEHIRDQRAGMVQTRSQFEFCLMAVAEETHAILKALPQ